MYLLTKSAASNSQTSSISKARLNDHVVSKKLQKKQASHQAYLYDLWNDNSTAIKARSPLIIRTPGNGLRRLRWPFERLPSAKTVSGSISTEESQSLASWMRNPMTQTD
jgi:hypothetical protein